MKCKHFMVDLETMGIRPTSAMVSIGVAHFDHDTVIDTFYTNVSLASCTDAGLTTDQSTVDWWLQQSIEARSAWQREDAPMLLQALKKLNDWMLSHGSIAVNSPWGNAASFDLNILRNAFEAIGADPPWKFYNENCFRTLKNLFDVARPIRKGTHHNAIDDAVHQAEHLHKIIAIHKVKLP